MTGSLAEMESTLRVTTVRMRSPPSQVHMRRKEPRGSPAQVRMSGSAISPPAVSPSHQVRQNVTASDQSMTPPASMETVPQTALIAVAVTSATSMPMI